MRQLFRLQPSRPDRAFHGLIYYRWTEKYMSVVRWFLEHGTRPTPVRAVRDATARHLQATHHAKVVPAADARRIITVDRPIEWRNLEHVVPYRVARDIVLDAPATIAVAQCACRAVAEQRGNRAPSCGPTDVCLYLGDPVASFVVAHQKGARFVSVDEALRIVDEAGARGNVHTLWFKDAAAGRMYALCNCCSCCCIGLKAREAGFDPLAGSGYVAAVDEGSCTACGTCVEACSFGAIRLDTGVDGRAKPRIDPSACLGCGVCVRACPSAALDLVRAETGAEPLPFDEGAPAETP